MSAKAKKMETEQRPYSRFLSMLRHDGDTEKRISQQVEHFLDQSFPKTVTEFQKKFERAAKEIVDRPLQRYKEQSELQAAWNLAALPPPVSSEKFMTHTNPEKTGILCATTNSRTLFTADDLKPLGLFRERETSWGDAVYDLYFSLIRLRQTICCLWAGEIIGGITTRMSKRAEKRDALPFYGRPVTSLLEMLSAGSPVGQILEFGHISEADASRFRELHEKASFGSGECEERAAMEFRRWLRKISIKTLIERGVTQEETHRLIIAVSQGAAKVLFDLFWNEEGRGYEFACFVQNRDACGFQTEQLRSRIPGALLMEFFKSADAPCEDLFRLLIREGWRKANDLARRSLA